MADTLPAWAAAIEPVDMDGAARVLGISRRTLVDVIAVHKHYDRRGSRKVFYPEHIALLREAWKTWRGSKSSGETASPRPSVPLPDTAYDKALALATAAKRKNSAPISKRPSGVVIPMERPPSEPSRRQP